MKRFLCTMITCSLFAIKGSAQVKPYMAVVNTGKQVFRGVLYQVTADSIGVKKEASIVFFKPCSIKNIKLREIKKGSKYMKYLTSDLYNERNYEKFTHKMVPVRKWGEKDPTIEEELSGRIISSFYSAAFNGLSASLGFMRGNLANIDVDYDAAKYKEEFKNLASRSILYQSILEGSSDAEDLKPQAFASKDN